MVVKPSCRKQETSSFRPSKLLESWLAFSLLLLLMMLGVQNKNKKIRHLGPACDSLSLTCSNSHVSQESCSEADLIVGVLLGIIATPAMYAQGHGCGSKLTLFVAFQSPQVYQPRNTRPSKSLQPTQQIPNIHPHPYLKSSFISTEFPKRNHFQLIFPRPLSLLLGFRLLGRRLLLGSPPPPRAAALQRRDLVLVPRSAVVPGVGVRQLADVGGDLCAVVEVVHQGQDLIKVLKRFLENILPFYQTRIFWVRCFDPRPHVGHGLSSPMFVAPSVVKDLSGWLKRQKRRGAWLHATKGVLGFDPEPHLRSVE